MRLYRACTINDRDKATGDYIISSASTNILGPQQKLEEITAHELNPKTGRKIWFSFSTSISHVKLFQSQNPEHMKICFFDFDLENPGRLASHIVDYFPMYLRDYVLCFIANHEEILRQDNIYTAGTNSTRNLFSFLNPGRRSITSLAYSLREVVVQCQDLKLTPLEEVDLIVDGESPERDMCLEFMRQIKRPCETNIKILRGLIEKEFVRTKVKSPYLRDRVNGEEWYKYAAE